MPGSRTSSTRQPGASGRSRLHEFLRRGEEAHVEADRPEQILERSAHGRIVVDDEDDCRARSLMHCCRLSGTGQREAEDRAVRLRSGAAHSRPPCASTIERLIDKPMPMPSALVV